MRRLIAPLLALGLLAAVPAAAAPGLVVAVDTSRSLTAAEVGTVAKLAGEALRQVPGAPPTALLSFDDLPRWVTQAGPPAATVAALGSLVPQGRTTQVHDALFVATRSLGEGGAVLLFTDGLDEDSATTIEDVARMCQIRGVRVIAVGAGRRVQHRSLRRLALLTEGDYLGTVGEVTPERLAGAARDALATTRTGPATAPGGTTAGQPASRGEVAVAERLGDRDAAAVQDGDTAGAAQPATESGGDEATGGGEASNDPTRRPWWLLALPLVAVAAVAPVAVWAMRRRKPRLDWCRRCGNELAAGEECRQCAEGELQIRLRQREMARLEDTAEFRIDTAVVEAQSTRPWNPDAVERTRVLTDQTVLLVREPGEAQRSYLLRNNGAFAVGRDPKANTLALRDAALSARHFMIVPEDGAYYVVDLDSTNGTFLNQRRVKASRLGNGDVVRAGQVDFEVRVYLSGVG
jgi:hypothetical protein